MTYTTAQTASIRLGWTQMLEIAELSASHGTASALRSMMRDDAKHRAGVTVSQAMMVAAFLEGYETPTIPASTLAGYAIAMREAMIYGARVATDDRDFAVVSPNSLARLKAAARAHQDERDARFTAIRADLAK
jgi:hypothetical protein